MRSFFSPCIAVISLLHAPLFVLAQNTESYLLVKDLPFVGDTSDLKSYFNNVFLLGLGIAVTLAILMIIINGIRYMVSDVIGDKIEAKDIIRNALIGLLLAFGSVLILRTINPALVRFDFLTTLEEAINRIPGPTTPGGGGVGAGACTDCVPMPAGIKCKDQNSCMVSAAIAQRIQALANNLGDERWQVTEGNPPTRGHSSACHTAGTCIDANFLPPDNTNPSAERISNFIDAASRSNLSACYELTSSSRRDELVAAGVPAGNLLVLPQGNQPGQISGPHFSVYSDGRSGCR